MKFSQTTPPKKYETDNYKQRVARTFERRFHNYFWKRSISDFVKKRKKFEDWIDFNRNLMIFQTKQANFQNEIFPNYASKKYETNNYK